MNQHEITNARMSAIFNEWARQHAEDPESFDKVLDENGRPLPGYGSACTAEFTRIAAEMDAMGALPVPSTITLIQQAFDALEATTDSDIDDFDSEEE